MQHLIEFLNRLVDDFSWKRLSLILSCLALIVISIITYEFYTNYFFLAKTEKTINLIKELSSLPPEVTNNSKNSLSNLTKTVTQQLNDATKTTPFHFELTPFWMKITASTIPWLLVLLIGVIVEKNDKATLAGGLVFVGIISVIVGIALPWQSVIWSNYWAYPIFHFIVVLWVLILYGNRTKKQP